MVAEEGPQYLSLTLYNPLFIPEDRTIEALRLVNQINQRQRVGRMAIVSNHLQYRALIDVEWATQRARRAENLSFARPTGAPPKIPYPRPKVS